MDGDDFSSPFRKSDPISILFMTWTIIMCIVGCTGNTLVIGAVLTHKKLQTLGNVFVTNLAVADLLVTSFVSTFGMIGILSDGYFFKGKTVLCNLVGIVCVISCSCSSWNIASISLNRYVITCHRAQYRKVYNVRTVPFIIAGLWFACFLIDLPNLVGWAKHSFDERIQLCTYDFTYSYSYTFFFICVGYGFPLCVSIFSYICIFRHTHRSNKILVQRAVWTTAYNQSVVSKRQMNADRRLLKSVLIILVMFVIMWTPYATLVIWDYKAQWPRLAHVIGAALAHGNSSINSYIYAASNKDFRRGYLVFIHFMLRRLRACICKIDTKRAADVSFVRDNTSRNMTLTTRVH